MIGGAVNKKFKPLVDEFKRWRVLLSEPYKRHQIRYEAQDYTDRRSFNPH
jgi:hypothetical protein